MDTQLPDPKLPDPESDGDPSTVKPAWYWIKDSKGYGSVTVTFTTIAFWVTTLAYVLSIVDHVGPVTIRPFDVAACSAYFIPILTLYFGRKFTEAKFSTPGK
jgi:hypothetical protein